MKKRISTAIIPLAIIVFSGCMGDHSSQHAKDTEQNKYKVAKDTGKVDSLPTDTMGIDNSASGGTKIAKPDSAKK